MRKLVFGRPAVKSGRDNC